jgi:hypothetical protein
VVFIHIRCHQFIWEFCKYSTIKSNEGFKFAVKISPVTKAIGWFNVSRFHVNLLYEILLATIACIRDYEERML